ncbi:helix-turn-helix domain-containing protein [Aliiglaciecola sp. LCG003]|uniref:helix-turn-helix domain-containing protein n=1 Tax=Aliiglaciecola sp. LCG003 TaxID=3053655 RepID=UPI002573E278|nr:helix-turn-helix domain-containing protein [Aliiglaciecola sp. LCG003]WJG09171.1 helix-turn-helix domain-containing protein [Aliiglaciecola sp. LCG003]
MSRIIPLRQTKACQNCVIKSVCPCKSSVAPLPSSRTGFILSSIKPVQRIYHRREVLFSPGDDFRGLYILHSGSAKTSIITADGEEQVSAFLRPNDLVGFDGFDRGVHACQASILETSCICFIDANSLHNVLGESEDSGKQLLQKISHALVTEYYTRLDLNNHNAEQRLAAFLLSQSDAASAEGLKNNRFSLSMTRRDLGNYLGMAIETASRQLNKLQCENIIRVNHRTIEILDMDSLKRICMDRILQDKTG